MCTLALVTAAAGLAGRNPLRAQTSDANKSTRRVQLEGLLGVTSDVPPGAFGAGMIVGAQAGLGAQRRGRLLVAASYLRELRGSGLRCCGHTPGFSYTQEAVVLGVGPEWQPGATGSGALAIDVQYNPTWHHTIRRGSQADFAPSPTRWHASLAVGSFGAVWRWRPTAELSARVGVRAYADLAPAMLLSGGRPVPWVALTAGVGPW